MCDGGWEFPQTLNPVFANKNVPPLEIVPRSYALIKRRYLIFRVMDWDRLSSNDYLGMLLSHILTCWHGAQP